jgi:putative endonuclease
LPCFFGSPVPDDLLLCRFFSKFPSETLYLSAIQLCARVAKWQTQGTFRQRRIRLRRKNPGENEPMTNLEELQPFAGVYVLLASDGEWMYKGSARDLRKRVRDHLDGKVSRTRNRRPLKLIHIEYTADYTEARRRENWLKSGQGRAWLKEQYARVAKWQTQGT